MKQKIPTQVRLFATDNDHTMVGYFAGAVPAWREQLPKIAKRLGISEEVAGRKLGTVFAKFATHDYPWAVALAFHQYWKGTVKDFVRLIEKPFWDAQDKYRIKYVKPYTGVEKALTELQKLGIPAVVVSDAPMFMCIARPASSSGLAKYFQGVYALECKAPDLTLVPSEEWLRFGTRRIATLNRKYADHGVKFVRELPIDHEKPDPARHRAGDEGFLGASGTGDSRRRQSPQGRCSWSDCRSAWVFLHPVSRDRSPSAEYLEYITGVLKPETDEFDGHGATAAPSKLWYRLRRCSVRVPFGNALDHLGFYNQADYLEVKQERLFRAGGVTVTNTLSDFRVLASVRSSKKTSK